MMKNLWLKQILRISFDTLAHSNLATNNIRALTSYKLQIIKLFSTILLFYDKQDS